MLFNSTIKRQMINLETYRVRVIPSQCISYKSFTTLLGERWNPLSFRFHPEHTIYFNSILCKKTYVDYHLQNVQVRFIPNRFITLHSQGTIFFTPCIIQKSNPSTEDNLPILSIKNNNIFNWTGVTIVNKRIHHSLLQTPAILSLY